MLEIDPWDDIFLNEKINEKKDEDETGDTFFNFESEDGDQEIIDENGKVHRRI